MVDRAKFTRKDGSRVLLQPPPPRPPPNLNSPDGYEIGRELGRGAFGVVYFVKQKTDQKILAMKIITVVDSVLQQQEIKILSKINHPNIVMFVRSFVQGHSVYILTELCEHGDLSIKVAEKKQQNKIFNAVLISNWIYMLIDAISYLHNSNIIHRDIKPSNIFIKDNQSIKLGDFGVSRYIGETSTINILSTTGTTKYMSPEMTSIGQTYSFNTDCWSLGCVLFELVTLEIFSDKNLKHYESITREIETLNTQNEFKELLKKMLQTDKTQRASSDELKLMIKD